jgi:hypothetical protein
VVQIVCYGDAADLIIEDLRLNRENGEREVDVIGDGLEGPNIDVDAELVLDEGLVRIESRGGHLFLEPSFLGNNFLNDFRRLALSLHEGQNMVDVVGNDVMLINKGQDRTSFFFPAFVSAASICTSLFFLISRLQTSSRIGINRQWSVLQQE